MNCWRSRDTVAVPRAVRVDTSLTDLQVLHEEDAFDVLVGMSAPSGECQYNQYLGRKTASAAKPRAALE
jgi:hypothetical protein